LALVYDCPICGFELMAGTEICPSCHVLFPNFCARCGVELEAGATACATCGTEVILQQRSGARLLQTVLVGAQRVAIVACPRCAHHFSPLEGHCEKCGYRLCPVCQIGLEEEELLCPRCGLSEADARRKVQGTLRCPACRKPVELGSEACPHCEQLLCPQCLSPVAETDLICSRCGAEFDLFCPECDTRVAADAEVCPACRITF
jgi:predicted amidophosphoribosyltransferase